MTFLTSIAWSDAAVQAALISSVGGIVAAVIAAVAATIIGRHFVNGKRLQEQLNLAHSDIAFLLAVEEEHCGMHMAHMNESFKVRVRSLVRDKGMVWSGRFTPGRVKARTTAEA